MSKPKIDDFCDLLFHIESYWTKTCYALYLHVASHAKEHYDGEFIDECLKHIKNCHAINKAIVDDEVLETCGACHLPELQEDELHNSLERTALPFMRSRKESVKKFFSSRGSNHGSSERTSTVYRSALDLIGNRSGSYKSVSEIIQEWYSELQREDVPRDHGAHQD